MTDENLTPVQSNAPISYFAQVDGAQIGPLDRAAVRSEIRAGELLPSTSIWRNGFSGWQIAKESPEFLSDFPEMREIIASSPPPFVRDAGSTPPPYSPVKSPPGLFARPNAPAFGQFADLGTRLAAGAIDLIPFLVGLVIFAAIGDWLFWIWSIVGVAYWTFMISSSGQTIGCRAMKIRVVDRQTRMPLAPVKSVVRGCVFAITWLFTGITYTSNPNRQTLHDLAGDSIVVQEATA